MKIPELRTFAYLAFAMPLFFAVMWILSATIDGEWTFGVNSLSDMGISDDPLSAFLFNFGCIATGFFGMIIGLGMFAYGKRTVRAGGILYTISTFFLALIGVFTLPQTMHYVVASTAGLVFSMSVVVTSPSDWKVSWYLYFDIVFMITSLIVMFTQIFVIWEPIMVIASMIWTASIGYRMLIHDSELYGEEPNIWRV